MYSTVYIAWTPTIHMISELDDCPKVNNTSRMYWVIHSMKIWRYPYLLACQKVGSCPFGLHWTFLRHSLKITSFKQKTLATAFQSTLVPLKTKKEQCSWTKNSNDRLPTCNCSSLSGPLWFTHPTHPLLCHAIVCNWKETLGAKGFIWVGRGIF